MTRRTRRIAVLISVGAAWSLSAATGQAAETPRHQLVKAYAPIVVLRAQEDPPCDPDEEQYLPTTVHSVLGNPRCG